MKPSRKKGFITWRKMRMELAYIFRKEDVLFIRGSRKLVGSLIAEIISTSQGWLPGFVWPG